MKSLLVDALRKAGERPAVRTDNEEEQPAQPLESSPSDADAGSADEAVLLPVLKLGDESSPDDSPIEQRSLEEPSLEQAGLEEAEPTEAAADELALAPELDSHPEHPPESTVAAAVSPASAELAVSTRMAAERVQGRETNWLYRAARWSPLLYLMALSSAAASYYGYQRLALAEVSTELGSMPTQLAYSDTTELEPENAWIALPESDEVASTAAPESDGQPVDRRPAAPVRLPPEQARQPTVVHVNDSVLPTLKEAYSAYSATDYERAEALYGRVLAMQPFHTQALAGRSAALQRLGRLQDAALTYEQLLKVEPDNAAAAAALVALAEQERAVGPSKETQLKLLAQRHPRVPEIQAALGKRYAEQRQWPEAYEAYSFAVAMLPARADYHYNAAVCAERLGRVATAREHYAAALLRSTNSATFDVEQVTAHLAALGAQEDSGL